MHSHRYKHSQATNYSRFPSKFTLMPSNDDASSSAPVHSKRLIVSGLTSSITTEALLERFASFGSVKAVDGIGLKDGNGKVCNRAPQTFY